jgi:ribonuclease J
MKITIHRGYNQIGGCITEIATATTKILIDLGHNLPKGNQPGEDDLANEEAIEKLTNNVNAIFYTHYHGDHVDLFKYVPDTVQYIGETAKQVMLCKYEILSKSNKIENVTPADFEKLKSFKTFREKQKITKDDITITPYFVSHSACDAYMFLIEAGGKRILHTGDFREHGYTGKKVDSYY